MTIIIPLTQGQETVISDEDADLADFKWCAQINPCYAGGGKYIARRRRGKSEDGEQQAVHLHRVILSRVLGRALVKSEFVDHIDLNPLNNCRENLRLASRSQNGANRKAQNNNKLGFKGVSYQRAKKKYLSQIKFNGKVIYLGIYPTPQEAHEAYKQAARELFGAFARFE